MDYGHGSSLTQLLKPKEELQALETLATTKCQEPAYRPPTLPETNKFSTNLHSAHQRSSPQQCLGLDIVASHLTSGYLDQQTTLRSGGHLHHNSGAGHLTRPRYQGNMFPANHNHQITASSPPNAQNNPDFPASLQYTLEPLDSPQSYQYTLPCNRRLDFTWHCPEPPERFNQVAERASAPLESTKGPPMKPQQPRKAPQLPPAPPPTSICHNFSGKIRN